MQHLIRGEFRAVDLKLALRMSRDTFSNWSEDNGLRLAAALAYYTIFSLAPLLVISIGIAGIAFGQDVARGHIVYQIRNLVGDQSAQAIQVIIENAGKSGGGPVAAIISIAALIFGTTGIFGQLQDALNTVWDVAPKPGRGIAGIIHDRIFSFILVIGLGFFLLLSLVISTGLAAIGAHFEGLLRGYQMLQTANFIISLLAITFIFAAIFKIVPDVDISWKDVFVGAIATSIFFAVGKFLVSIYLGYSAIASVYGVAGSLMVLLLWIFYSANVLLLGAEFTRVYANATGSKVAPKNGAVKVVLERKVLDGNFMPSSMAIEAPGGKETNVKFDKQDGGILSRVLSATFHSYALRRRKL